MKCPICKKAMKVLPEETHYREDGKEYIRTMYHCNDCDTWVGVEIPKNG